LGWPADHPGARWADSSQPTQQYHSQPPKLVWSSSPQSPLRQSPATTPPSVVVLSEKEPTDLAGERFYGSAIWRTETVTSRPGHPPELAVRADIEVPERKLAMTWVLRRNTNHAPPTTHTIEVTFSLPADFPFGGVNSVSGVLMKEAYLARGAPLSGSAIQVTPTFFLFGLSALESVAQRNLELLRERSWLDIPVVYGNGRRAIIAVEKGTPGERVFADAFKAWKE
jgi:hypothetical protein